MIHKRATKKYEMGKEGRSGRETTASSDQMILSLFHLPSYLCNLLNFTERLIGALVLLINLKHICSLDFDLHSFLLVSYCLTK